MMLLGWITPLLMLVHAEGVTFEKQRLRFNNGAQLQVEVAKTDEQRTQGLMFRTKLPDGTGMLFIFPDERHLGFWMKNTLLPLSIGYFNSKRELIEVLDMVPPLGPVRDETLPRYPSSKPAMFALEVPQGWFTTKKVRPGATFKLSK